MATYRYVLYITNTEYSLANISKEGSYTSAIDSIFAHGVEDVDGEHSGGLLYSTSPTINSCYSSDGYYKVSIGNYTWPSYVGKTDNSIGFGYGYTYKIPAGSYFGTATTDIYYEDEDGSSGYKYSTIGFTTCCFISTNSFSTASNYVNSYIYYDEDDDENTYNIYYNSLWYALTDILFCEWNDNNGSGYNYVYMSGTAQYVKGTITSSSSTSYSVYPNAGAGYNTKYTIEPSSIAISTSSIMAGKSATISITRSSSSGDNASTYGYPITYTYQYSTDSGSTWTTIGSTTATTQSFTVPSSAKSIMVRALSSDSLGTGGYVTSSSYTVTSSITYTSVSGVIKTLNPVVAYGGGGTYGYCRSLQRRSYQDSVILSLVVIATFLHSLFYL